MLGLRGLKFFNPFVPNAPFLYPLQTSKNFKVEMYWEDIPVPLFSKKQSTSGQNKLSETRR